MSCPPDEHQRLALGPAAGERADIELSVTSKAWLEIEEQGLELESGSSEHLTELRIAGPPRFGWRFLQIEFTQRVNLTRTRRGDHNTSALLSLHCEISADLQRRLDWFRESSRISAQVREQVPIADLESSLAEIDSLILVAPDAKTHASALHLRAQALLFAGRSVDATAAFALAEEAWISLGDLDRARVARVARVEDSIRSGQYAKAIELAGSFPTTPGSDSYFGVRMERSRCLALTYLARTTEAENCFPPVLSRLEALDEQGEVANTLQAYAGLEITAANYLHAEQLARRALDLAAGIDASLYRGRIHLLLADIALRRGLVSESLRDCELALTEFSEAHATRWEANTMLKVARLHENLGDYDEAYAFLAEALRRLSARDAPSRWAIGMELFADLERDHNHLESAYIWQRAAEELYSQLGMAGDLEAATLSRLRLLLRTGDLASVKLALANRKAVLPLNAPGFALLEANLALRAGQVEAARQSLDELWSRPMSLEDQVNLSRMEGEYKDATGDVRGALAGLLEQGQRIENLADRVQSEVLRQIVARQSRTLRQTAFRVALEHRSKGESIPGSDHDLWRWLALNASNRDTRGSTKSTTQSAEKFENAVAAELFAPTAANRANAESAARHELLALLTGSERSHQASRVALPTLQLERLQQKLGAGSAFIAYLDGDTKGAVLWVTSGSVDIIDSAPPRELRAHVMALRDLVRSANSSVADIHNAADQLSSDLFGDMANGSPPRHLYILADEPFSAVPWGVLTWPGASIPMLDTTDVEYMRVDSGNGGYNSPMPIDLHVIVAAQPGDHPALPALTGADMEGAAIDRAMRGAAVVMQTPGATRTTVLSALRVAGAWVHIAAHGMAQPQRIGYAGIWLDPTGEDRTPPFLSWIDILDSGVNADLVVLNACQLGDSGAAINGNLSFADAVSRAGARHVVASLWPVSDAAAALWVSEFYSEISADPYHDTANALRAAQRRLRDSRSFRHPFFWAGMQTINRMSLDAQTRH